MVHATNCPGHLDPGLAKPSQPVRGLLYAVPLSIAIWVMLAAAVLIAT